jgi:hypothetical protein
MRCVNFEDLPAAGAIVSLLSRQVSIARPEPASGFRQAASHVPVAVFACVVLAGIVLSYAGLIGMGQWQGDEYIQVAFYRQLGFHEYIARVLGWSPRPISELLFWLYAEAVGYDRRPHIIPFLSLLWAIVILATVVTIRPSSYRGVLRYRLLLSLALLAIFLVGHPISELFYWPAGSAAYLPTLAAILVSFFLLIDRRQATPGRALAGTAALLVAAGSSEVGMLFVLCLSAVRLQGLLMKRRGHIAAWLHWSAPVALSLAILALLLSVRAGTYELPGNKVPYFHLPLASLLAALPQTLRGIATLDGEQAGAVGAGAVVTALLVRLLFFLGVRWTWQAANRGSERVQGAVGFALTCLAASYLTLAVADYQFGLLCCERHAALRQCFYALAVAALGVWSANGRWRVTGSIAPLPLVLAVLIPFARTGVGSLRHDYRLYRTAIATRSWNWHEGQRRDSDSMVFLNEPIGQVCHGGGLPPGRFVLDPDIPWWARGIMLFYGKRELEIRLSPSVP